MPTTPSRRTARTRLADLEQPLTTPAWAAPAPGVALAPFTITRRRPGPHEVLIDILYCGVCHTDIHQVRDEWRRGIFPMVPGHEIVGRVAKAGEAVTRWKTGDSVGVGCFVDSCRECEACRAGEEQYCVGEGGPTFTYGDTAGSAPVPSTAAAASVEHGVLSASGTFASATVQVSHYYSLSFPVTCKITHSTNTHYGGYAGTYHAAV